MLNLGLLPVEAVFWIGFALPIPLAIRDRESRTGVFGVAGASPIASVHCEDARNKPAVEGEPRVSRSLSSARVTQGISSAPGSRPEKSVDAVGGAVAER